MLRPDSGDVVELGAVSLQVIERGGRFGIRLKDKNAAARREFTGCRWYEIQESYRIEAKWVAHPQPRPLKVPNILGQTESMPSPGYAEFSVGGKTVRLDGVLETPQSTQLWFILRDQTSGHETYPAGRFLYADLPKAGKVVLDFNKAYNPPCAFTAYATCPLPPPQNWMPVQDRGGRAELRHAWRQIGTRGCSRGRSPLVPKNASHQPGHSCPLRDRSWEPGPRIDGNRTETGQSSLDWRGGLSTRPPLPSPLDARHVPLVDLHVVVEVVLRLLVLLAGIGRFEKVWK